MNLNKKGFVERDCKITVRDVERVRQKLKKNKVVKQLVFDFVKEKGR